VEKTYEAMLFINGDTLTKVGIRLMKVGVGLM
jgi:hypothetical protein